jgi:hypothetical protein
MALSFIPESEVLMRVKVCFLTAGEMYYKEIRKEAFPELDINCFIGKPIANQDLVGGVKDVLELK